MRALALIAVLTLATGATTSTDYLLNRPMPDLMQILPAPPKRRSPQNIDDRATFRETRAILGTLRGDLAPAT